MIILDGKTISQKIIDSLKTEIQVLKIKPILDIVVVGNDPASQKYVAMKQKKANSIGIGGQIHQLDQDSTTEMVLSQIEKLNKDQRVQAFMVQLPLPSQIDTQKVLSHIDPKKDADGLNPLNLGLLFQKKSEGIASATALGIIKLLEAYKINIDKKNVVIVGRSPEVAIPLFALLTTKNATVTVCHSHTQNLQEICLGADILISAVGKPKIFNQDFVKPGTVVIDVGFSLDANGRVSGDFDFDKVAPLSSFITPVPGGVGPMTVTSLLFNTVDLIKKNHLL